DLVQTLGEAQQPIRSHTTVVVCDCRERRANVLQADIGGRRDSVGRREDALDVHTLLSKSRDGRGCCGASALIDDDQLSGPDAPLPERFEAPIENRSAERWDNDSDVVNGTPTSLDHGRGAATNSSKGITASTSVGAGHGRSHKSPAR